MARRKKKLNTARSSKLSLALIVTLILVLVFMLQSMNTQLAYAESEYEIYASRLASLQEKNAHLRQNIENCNDPSLIEDIARNDLGMASYGEKIFRFQY